MTTSPLTGKKVRLIRMEDPYTNLKSGDEGTIKGVDGIGQIMVNWDNGSSLSLMPDIDEYEILENSNLKYLTPFKKYEND